MQHTNELQERRESDGRKQRTHKAADFPSVWRWCSNVHRDNICWLLFVGCISPLLMAHLVCLCPPWDPTNFIPMDVAAPSPDAQTICSLVCALLPAVTFPAFLQFA